MRVMPLRWCILAVVGLAVTAGLARGALSQATINHGYAFTQQQLIHYPKQRLGLIQIRDRSYSRVIYWRFTLFFMARHRRIVLIPILLSADNTSVSASLRQRASLITGSAHLQSA
jgi:hypothetical protein